MVLETGRRRWDEHVARLKGNEKCIQNFIRGNLKGREPFERLRQFVSLGGKMALRTGK
jgi:hypothetical protein